MWHKFAIALFFVIIVLIAWSLRALTFEENPFSKHVIVKVADNTAVIRLNAADGQSHQIYNSAKYWIHDISVSPDDRYIAFIEETKPVYSRDDYEVPPEICLVIIAPDGKLAQNIPADVKCYDWSPDGKKIAYLTFDPCDPDYAYKCPTGAWIADLESSNRSKIFEGARDISWATHDDNIYLHRREKVWVFNVRTQTVSEVDIGDIQFSPDGKYYLDPPDMGSNPRTLLFLTDFNQEMTNRLPPNLGSLGGWIFNDGHFLLYTDVRKDIETEGNGPIKAIRKRTVTRAVNFIYDPSEERVVDTVHGVISDWIGNGDFIIIEQNGLLRIIDNPK